MRQHFKRIITIVFVLLLSCCGNFNNSSLSSIDDKTSNDSINETLSTDIIDTDSEQELKSVRLVASHYLDYNNIENIDNTKASLLLDGNYWCFNYLDYDLKKPLAGDAFTIFFYGEMYFIETFPGDIILEGEIVNVEQELVDVAKCVVNIDENGERYVDSIDDSVSFNHIHFEWSIDSDSYLHDSLTLNQGTILYVTYSYINKRLKFYSFYDYDITIR